MVELTPEQIAEQDKIERDMRAFNDGLSALIQKTGITVVAKLVHSEDGDRPVLKLARFTPAPAPSGPVKAPKAKAPAAPVAPKKRNAKAGK